MNSALLKPLWSGNYDGEEVTDAMECKDSGCADWITPAHKGTR